MSKRMICSGTSNGTKARNVAGRITPTGQLEPTRAFKPISASSNSRVGWCFLVLFGAVTASPPAPAQQKTGPGITGEDSLTWKGITFYGVVDIGFQYDTHSAPFTP